MAEPKRVLIVDDDPDLVQMIELHLARAGFATRAAATVADALPLARTFQPHLVLLDLRLPDGSGKDVCRSLKSEALTRRIAIIMVTALAAEVDRVVGFELGADDYVTKPFSARELVLRIHAVLRRSSTAPAPRNLNAFGRVTLDPVAQRVYVDGAEVPLTPLEFRILSLLVHRRERMQSRQSLVVTVWGQARGEYGRRVDTHVARLRRKLGPARDYIRTDRGVGYGFFVVEEG